MNVYFVSSLTCWIFSNQVYSQYVVSRAAKSYWSQVKSCHYNEIMYCTHLLCACCAWRFNWRYHNFENTDIFVIPRACKHTSEFEASWNDFPLKACFGIDNALKARFAIDKPLKIRFGIGKQPKPRFGIDKQTIHVLGLISHWKPVLGLIRH